MMISLLAACRCWRRSKEELQELIDQMGGSSLQEYLEAYLSITLVGAEFFVQKDNHAWCPRNENIKYM